MKKMGLIFFNIDKVSDEKGTNKIEKLVGLKLNPDLRVMSNFEEVIDVNNSEGYKVNLSNMLLQFEKWVNNPYENKFVTFDQQDLIALTDACKSIHLKTKIKDFYKIMGYQYWNIQNELAYRLGISKDTTLEESLSVYGLSFVGKKQTAQEKCFNTYTLAMHFKTDERRNSEVFKNHSRGKSTEKNNTFSVLNFQPIRSLGEEMLRQKMQEGWNVAIECMVTSSGANFIYEGKAFKSSEYTESAIYAKGKSLEELMYNLFEEVKC